MKTRKQESGLKLNYWKFLGLFIIAGIISTSVVSAQDTEAPTIPAGLSASAYTDTSFTLIWSASTDNIGITGYEIFQDGSSIGATSDTSFSVTGLTFNTTYVMTVRSRDAVPNWSSQSDSLTVTTHFPSASYKFLKLTLRESSGAAMNINDIIYYSGGEEYPTPKMTADISNGYIITTEGPLNNAYRAFDNSLSSSCNVTGGGAGLPASIILDFGTNPQIMPEKIQFTLPNSSYILGSFEVLGSNDGVAWTTLVDVPDAGIDWRYKTFKIINAPSPPQSVSPSNIKQTEFDLSWTLSPYDLGLTDYEVFRDGVSLGTTTETSMEIDGLVCGTTYNMTVKARNSSGYWSGLSDTCVVTTAECDAQVPTIPTGLDSVDVTPQSFKLLWTASTDDVAVTAYEIFCNDTSIGVTESTWFTVINLKEATTYPMSVRARDAAGNWSARSTALDVTTTSASSEVYVSDLDWESGYGFDGVWSYTHGSGTMKDESARYGGIVIGGVTYTKGIGAFAYSEVYVDLGQRYSRFISDIGINNNAGGSVVFKVYCDGILSYASDTFYWSTPTGNIDIPVTGVTELKLVVEDAGDGTTNDDAAWGNARLESGLPSIPAFPDSVNILNIGNSHSASAVRYQVMRNAVSSGYDWNIDFPDLYNNCLVDQWDRGTGPRTPRGLIMSGNFTHLALQPCSEEWDRMDDMKTYGKLFMDLARDNNLKLYLYEKGSKADQDLSIQLGRDLNYGILTDYCGQDVTLIPVGQTFYNIRLACMRNEIKDFDAWNLYMDDAHMQSISYYINSLVHFAVINQQSPEGLPTYNDIYNTSLNGSYPSKIEGISDESILKMQKIVWNTVKSNKHAKIDTTLLPTAELSASESTVPLNTLITFSASGSSAAPGRKIVKYKWSFGEHFSYWSGNDYEGDDFITPNYETTSPTVTHAFSKSGDFIVRLVAVQDDGKTSSNYMIIKAGSHTPSASFTADRQEVYSTPAIINFNASASNDPNGSITNYLWDFGDGSPIQDLATPVTSYTYTNSGTYNVILTVRDNDSQETSMSMRIIIGATAFVDSLPTIDESGFMIPSDGGKTASLYNNHLIRFGSDAINLLKFDLTKYSESNITIQSAKLRMNCFPSPYIPDLKQQVTFKEISDQWEGSSVLFENCPSPGSDIVQDSVSLGWYEFDITDYINQEFSSDKIVSVAMQGSSTVDQFFGFEATQRLNDPLLILSITTNIADTENPTSPTNLTASDTTQTSVTLTWTASTDNVGVTAYNIYNEGTFLRSVGSDTLEISLTGLTCNTLYSFNVKATDAAGNVSDTSNTCFATTLSCILPDTEAPTVPTGLASSSITETSFTLSWTASTDNVGVTGYEVFRNDTSIGTTASNTMPVSGLICGNTYSMTVRARDAAGNWSAQSTALNVNTLSCPDTEAPSVPTGLSSSDITEVSFTLNWTASTDNIGVTGYEVFQDGVSLGTTASTSMDITELSCEISYAMTVRARDAADNWSAQSTALDVATSACSGDTEAPTVPTGLVSSAITETSFTLTWTASTDNIGVTAYEVFQDGISLGTTALTSMDVTGLSCGASYAMTVRARDGAGNWSAQSTALNVNTLPCPDTEAPSVTTGLSSSAVTDTSFSLSWTASTDNVGVTEYEVFVDGVSAGTSVSTTFDVSGLLSATTYSITVLARDAAGNISAESVALNITTSTLISIGKNESKINVYPNPANSFIIIELESKESVSIQLLSTTGNILEMRNNVSGTIKLNIENYSGGMYLLKIISENNTKTIKLIKND